MVGNSTHSAPSSERRATKSLACSRALVTKILFPKRGLSSNQLSSFLRPTTSPTTMIAGGLIFSFWALSPMFPREPMTVLCPGTVPARMTATGVSGERPCSMRLAAILGGSLPP